MYRTLVLAVTAATFAVPAVAQTTTAQVVGGASGNAAYPIEVIGANGVRYFCRSNGISATGGSAYACIRPSAAGGLALNNGAAIGVGVGVAALAALVGSDSTDGTEGEDD